MIYSRVLLHVCYALEYEYPPELWSRFALRIEYVRRSGAMLPSLKPALRRLLQQQFVCRAAQARTKVHQEQHVAGSYS